MDFYAPEKEEEVEEVHVETVAPALATAGGAARAWSAFSEQTTAPDDGDAKQHPLRGFARARVFIPQLQEQRHQGRRKEPAVFHERRSARARHRPDGFEKKTREERVFARRTTIRTHATMPAHDDTSHGAHKPHERAHAGDSESRAESGAVINSGLRSHQPSRAQASHSLHSSTHGSSTVRRVRGIIGSSC